MIETGGTSRWTTSRPWAEAIFYLAGPDAAAQAVWRWHPESYALRIAEHLVERLAQRAGRVDLSLWIEQQDLPIESEVRLLGAVFQSGGSASPSQLQRVCRQLIDGAPPGLHERDETWPAELIEQAASLIDNDEVLDLIEALRPATPDRVPHRGLGDWEAILRFACLEAVVSNTDLDTERLLPSRLQESADTDKNSTQRQVRRLEEERTKLLRVLKEASSLYLLRASSAAGKVQADEVVSESLRLLEALFTQRYQPYDWFRRSKRTARAVFDSLCLEPVLTLRNHATGCLL